MGGTSGQIQDNSLIELLAKYYKIIKVVEQSGLYIDSVNIIQKIKGKKSVVIGFDGMAIAMNSTYGKKQRKKFMLCYHART